MIEFLLFWCIVVICIWWMAPRMFLWADRHLARRNIATEAPHQKRHVSPTTLTKSHAKTRSIRVTATLSDFSQALDTLARSTRSHVPARDALIEIFSSLTTTARSKDLLHQLQQSNDIETVLRANSFDHSEARFLQLLHHSLVHGSFVPQALEQSAVILREEEQHQQNMRAAAAQTQSTVRLLSLLPFIVLTVLLMASPTFQRELMTPPTLALIAFGVILNRAGWSWVQTMVARASRTVPSVSSQLSDAVHISLRAGIPLRQAIEMWAVDHDSHLAAHLTSGIAFADVLNEFAQRHRGDTHVLTRLFIDADRDGLPVTDTVHRLSTEMRMQRRHTSDIRLRQLPTQLALPVVFCVLPSFILLTVLPLVFANLHHLHFSPPSINTAS